MRSRNIKPGFFENEVLGVLPPLTCLLFAGLPCLADREGRLEDRPIRIKGLLFPYREYPDIDGDLTVLARSGFIVRYESDGGRYIQIANFKKHQSPHHTERKSDIPPPRESRKSNGENPPDSLIPDSPIPESSVPNGTAQGVDVKTTIFGSGLKYLAKQSGKTEASLRPLLGRWCRDHGDGNVAGALVEAQRFAPVDPVSFIEKQLRGKGHGKHAGFEQQDYYEGTDGFDLGFDHA